MAELTSEELKLMDLESLINNVEWCTVPRIDSRINVLEAQVKSNEAIWDGYSLRELRNRLQIDCDSDNHNTKLELLTVFECLMRRIETLEAKVLILRDGNSELATKRMELGERFVLWLD